MLWARGRVCDSCAATILARSAVSPYSGLIVSRGIKWGMKRYKVDCSTALLTLAGLAMFITLVLGISEGVLKGLKADSDSLRILLMIYGSYPLFMLLQLWTGRKRRVECWLLTAGWVLIAGCALYSWALVVIADHGAIPALIMVWYGMLQTVVVAGLFILLALIRLWHFRRVAMTE